MRVYLSAPACEASTSTAWLFFSSLSVGLPVATTGRHKTSPYLARTKYSRPHAQPPLTVISFAAASSASAFCKRIANARPADHTLLRLP